MSAYRRFFDTDAQNGRNVTNSNLELDLFTKAHHVEMLNHYFKGQIDYSLQWSDIIYSYIKNYFKEKEPYTLKKILYLYRHADKRTRKRIRKEFGDSIKRKVTWEFYVNWYVKKTVSNFRQTAENKNSRASGCNPDWRSAWDSGSFVDTATVVSNSGSGKFCGKQGCYLFYGPVEFSGNKFFYLLFAGGIDFYVCVQSSISVVFNVSSVTICKP